MLFNGYNHSKSIIKIYGPLFVGALGQLPTPPSPKSGPDTHYGNHLELALVANSYQAKVTAKLLQLLFFCIEV